MGYAGDVTGPPTDRLRVGPEGDGSRLDAWLARAIGVARSEAERLIGGGHATVDGEPAPKSLRLREGQEVVVRRPPPAVAPVVPATFEVRFEDAHLAVVAKPAGVVVHPAPGAGAGSRQTLVEALAGSMTLARGGGPGRPGVVHRLDRDTSGLIVVAKTDEAHRLLVEQMKARRVERTYLALVAGAFRMPAGRIEAPLGRSPRDPTRRAVLPGGREAVTEFTVIEEFAACSLLEVRLHTGRTHQIRVHLSHVGHPVVGDRVYGRATARLAGDVGLSRPFLHAARLRLVHPVTGEEVEVDEPLPADLRAALRKVREARGGARPPREAPPGLEPRPPAG